MVPVRFTQNEFPVVYSRVTPPPVTLTMPSGSHYLITGFVLTPFQFAENVKGIFLLLTVEPQYKARPSRVITFLFSTKYLGRGYADELYTGKYSRRIDHHIMHD